MDKKSLGIAVLLAVLFGPLGVFYASAKGALVLIAVALGGLVVVGPLIGTVVWLAAIVWAIMAVQAHNETAVAAGAVDEEWGTLIKYDADAGAAVEILKEFGQAAIDDLRKVHQVVKDVSKLRDAAIKIAAEYRARAEQASKGKSCPNCKTEVSQAVCPTCHAWVG